MGDEADWQIEQMMLGRAPAGYVKRTTKEEARRMHALKDQETAKRLLGEPSRKERRKQFQQQRIEERMRRAAKMLGGTFVTSARGTPHILVEIDQGVEASVCFFASSQTWRVFYPFGVDRPHQHVTTHRSLEEVEARIEEIEGN